MGSFGSRRRRSSGGPPRACATWAGSWGRWPSGTVIPAGRSRGTSRGRRRQQAAGWLDEREPGEVLDEVRTYARRNPGTFLAGAAVAGLLVGRLTRGLTAPASGNGQGGGHPAIRHQRRAHQRRPLSRRTSGRHGRRTSRRQVDPSRTSPAGGPVSAPEKERSQASVGELLGDVTRDMSTLVRKEVELAKAELREEVSQAGKAGGMFGGAALAGFLAVLFVSYALWWGLSNTMDQGGRR
ncbi:phage holin family protein [Micromonospora sp. M12]